MDFLVRFTISMLTVLALAMPAYASVAMPDPGACDIVAAEGDKKPEGGKKPEEGEKEPDCE